jgi:nitrate/TMAO reductase-like tetraheme cytochrome c subunit
MGEKKTTSDEVSAAKPVKKTNWLKISIIANIVILVVVAIAASTMAIVHQADTNPKFCASCHIMAKNVDSYMTGSNLDHVHELAGVQCKQCHEYPLSAEITSGIKFVTGNYEVGADGELAQRKYDDSMCLKCHISYEFVDAKTSSLDKDPHNSHLGQMPCSTCHVSHGEQVDYCAQCHDHGDQVMIKAPDAKEATEAPAASTTPAAQ